jgi:hypothetical protein
LGCVNLRYTDVEGAEGFFDFVPVFIFTEWNFVIYRLSMWLWNVVSHWEALYEVRLEYFFGERRVEI